MVMRAMRENTKPILWIAVIAFVLTIFAVWGLDLRTGSRNTDPNILGKVNGVPIMASQYRLVYEQIARQMRSGSEEALTYAQEQFISSQAWDNIVYTVLTQQEIDRLGIKVSDPEILVYLRTSPPMEIRQYFLDEQGNFDNDKYQAALNNPEIDWTNLEDLARDRIPRMKLNQYLASQIHVGEEEVRRAYEMDTARLVVQYVEFKVADVDLGQYEPTDEELEHYYTEHDSDFAEPEKARLNVVQIPLAPSPSDLADVRFMAERILEQIKGGEQFSDMAKTYSEAPTSFVDGNTGFISRHSRGDAYFDALDAVADGELAGPVHTEAGYYVLKRLGKKENSSGESQYNAQEILVKPTMSRSTSDSLFALADSVINRAKTTSLEAAAGAYKLRPVALEPFAKGDPIPTLGLVPSLNEFAFSAQVGAISSALRDDKNIYIGWLQERIARHTPPLDEVRDRVRTKVIADKRQQMAERDADAFFVKVRRGDDFEESAAAYGRTVTTLDTFTGAENIPGFGPNSELADAALSIQPDQASPPIKIGDAFVVLKLLSRSEIDAEDYKKRYDSVLQRLQSQRAQEYVTRWYQNLKERSKIEDFRTRT